MAIKRTQMKKKAGTRDLSPQLSRFKIWYANLIFLAVGILIAYPPYFRGLFFSEDISVFHIVSSLVIILVLIGKVSRREYKVLETPLDWAILAYAGAYLLSLIGAIHFGEAFHGFLKALNYFMVYWMVSNVVKNYTDYTNILRIILAAGTGIAVIGLLAATGHSNYPAAFDGKVILSTLQYRNATGAYLLVTTLIGATLWIREPKIFLRPLYSLANYLMLLVIMATLSKGSWAVLMLGIILLLVGMPGRYRIKAIYVLAVSGAAALLTAIKFLPAITGNNSVQALPYLLIGLTVVIIGELLWHLLLFTQQKRKIAISAGVVMVLMAAALTWGLSSSGNLLGKALQGTSLVTQFANLKNTQDPSFILRYDHYRWGWAIFKDHPIIGTGVGGWNALYHQYQDYLFWTTETHNHFLQVMVETGIIGLTAFLSMWVCMLLPIYRRWKGLRADLQTYDSDHSVDSWILNWGTAVAALSAGAHAAIDFDLSLGAIAILLWSLLALVNAGARMDKYYIIKPSARPWLGMTIAAILAVVFLISSLRIAAANNLCTDASALYNNAITLQNGPEKDLKLAEVEKLVAQAEDLDSFDARYTAVLVQARSLRYTYLVNNHNPAAADKLREIQAGIQRTLKISPYDVKIRGAMFSASLMINDIDGALAQSQYVIKMNPNDANAYNNMISLFVTIADQKFKMQQIPEGVHWLKEAVGIAQEMEQQKLRLNPARMDPPYWNGVPLALSPESQLNLAKAEYLLTLNPLSQ